MLLDDLIPFQTTLHLSPFNASLHESSCSSCRSFLLELQRCLHVTCLKELQRQLVCKSSNLFLLFSLGNKPKTFSTGRARWVHQTISVEPTTKFITVGLRFLAVSGRRTIPVDKHELSFCLLQRLQSKFPGLLCVLGVYRVHQCEFIHH